MNAQDLRNSILQLAIQGKLVEQREEEGTAEELYTQIQEERQRLIEEGYIKKKKKVDKIAEEEIPFEIPPNWKWLRVSELGEVIGGGTPKTSINEYWKDGNIPWLTPADMKNVEGKYVSSGSRSITKEGLQSSSARLMPKGTIVYSSRAPIGYIAISQNEISTNQGFKSLVPLIEEINEYMYFCLISRTSEIQSRASGTTFKEISGTEFGKTLVPLPPIEEQKRIVAKVEELMPLVEKYGDAHTAVTDLNEQFPVEMEKSILQYAIQGKLVEQRPEEGTAEELYEQIQKEKQELVESGKIKKQKELSEITDEEIPFDIPNSWKWVRLRELAVNIHYGYTASANDLGNSKLLRITDIQNDHVDWINVPYCNVTDAELEKYKLYNRDIVIARTGGTIGKTYIVRNLENVAVFASYLIRLIPLEGISVEFLKMFMGSPLYWKQLKQGSMGTGQPNVNATTLSRLVVPLPPLGEQTRIVKEIKRVSPYTKHLIK